ncbi:MAG: hypothetical protein KBF88_14915, partial [Polyangiaceae bacterium]|nr:hypothetical protein [Polyangiaceae bacterium]
MVTLANSAFAQQIFREDFEAAAPAWNTIAGFATNPLVYQGVRTLNLVSENSNAACSGTFQRERIAGSGGRAFASGAVQTVVVND